MTSVADFQNKSHCRHANKKREQKNRKFGFGGQKKRAKRNTKESMDMPWQKLKTKSAKSKVGLCVLSFCIFSVQVNLHVTVWLAVHHLPVFLTHMQNCVSVTLWSVFMSVRGFKFVDESLIYIVTVPEGRLGMSNVILLSGISGLSFDSPFPSPLLSFLPSPLALSVLSFFC